MKDTIELLKQWLDTQPKCAYCKQPAVQYQETGDWSGSNLHYFCSNNDHALTKSEHPFLSNWIDPKRDYHNRILIEKTISYIKQLEEKIK